MFPVEQIEAVAKSKQWLNLLHYRKKPMRKIASEVDGPEFFFSPDGRTDAKAELLATLRAPYEKHEIGPLKQTAVCAFPARFRFLETELNVRFPAQNCEKRNEFLATFHNPQSVSLIFSSAYANNPASMFGHLFLKIGSSRSSELLDMGINFAAAVAQDENPFAFIYFGVVGGYQGRWSSESFYRKVNEYVRSENRDLWEYELALTPEEARQFIDHLWELETTSYFWYYFFDENCAYQIVRALEAVKPEWNLSSHTIYAIPGEIVKNITDQEGAVREIRYRPSLRKSLTQAYNILDTQEQDDFFNLINRKSEPTKILSTWTLDAASKYFEFIRQKNEGFLSEADQEHRNAILNHRAALGVTPQTRELPPIPHETRPDLGHDAYEISWRPGILRDQNENWNTFQSLKFKFAYHDLLNKDLGFTRYSEIDFPWIELRHLPYKNALHFEEFGGLRITSINPLNRLNVAPSWKFYGALDSPKDYGCVNCRHASVEAGLGLSFETFDYKHIAYSFVTARGEASESLKMGYRLLPGIEAGFLGNPWPNYKFQVLVKHQWDVSPRPVSSRILTVHVNQAYSLARNWEIRQEARQILDPDAGRSKWSDASLSLKHFFR